MSDIHMPWSPLDALLDALPALRKAGRVTKDDDVLSVQKRMADVLRPIVKRIHDEAYEAGRKAGEQTVPVRRVTISPPFDIGED